MLFSCPCFCFLFDPLLFSGACSFYFLLFWTLYALFWVICSFICFSCLFSFYFKYSRHVGTPNRSILYKTRTQDHVSVVLVLWGQAFTHNQVVVPHKLNEARGLARYPEHLRTCLFLFGLWNGVEYGMGHYITRSQGNRQNQSLGWPSATSMMPHGYDPLKT